MTKLEFLDKLRTRLKGLPLEEIEERIGFYKEMIEDRMEEGLSEEEAVESIGDIESLAEQIISESDGAKEINEGSEKNKSKLERKSKLSPWIIALLVLGAPVWFSIAIGAISVIFSGYMALWSVAISLWATFGALAGTFVGGIILGVVNISTGSSYIGIALIGASIVCAGLAIFMFFLAKLLSKGIVYLTRLVVLGIKSIFTKGRKGNEEIN